MQYGIKLNFHYVPWIYSHQQGNKAVDVWPYSYNFVREKPTWMEKGCGYAKEAMLYNSNFSSVQCILLKYMVKMTIFFWTSKWKKIIKTISLFNNFINVWKNGRTITEFLYLCVCIQSVMLCYLVEVYEENIASHKH